MKRMEKRGRWKNREEKKDDDWEEVEGLDKGKEEEKRGLERNDEGQ